MVRCRCKKPRWGSFLGRKGIIQPRCKKCYGLPPYSIKAKPS